MITEQLLKGYVENSTTMLNWTITLIGASFLVILSDSYFKPVGVKKAVYLLFFPAWCFMACSVKNALNMANTFLGRGFLDSKAKDYAIQLIPLGKKINSNYNDQINNFYLGCSIMSICFAILVLFFIFNKKTEIDK